MSRADMARTPKRDVTLTPELQAALGKGSSRFFSDWPTSCMPADYELRGSLRRLRARARDLAAWSALMEQAMTVYAMNLIGPTGMDCRPMVRDSSGKLDDRANGILKEGWNDFWTGPVTADGKLTGVEYEHLLVKTWLVDGENFTRRWQGYPNKWGIAFEPIDSDLLEEWFSRTASRNENEVRLSVEVDDFGRPVAYHVLDGSPLIPMGGPRTRERIPAEDLRHIYIQKRVNQTRGVTALRPVLVLVKMDDGYTEAELFASRLGASKGLQIRDIAGPNAGEIGEEDDEGGYESEIEPAMIWKPPAGKMLEAINMDHPSTAFDSFTRAIIRKISAGLGISYPTLSMDFENTSYSSARTAIGLERDLFQVLHEIWIHRFRNWVYREWLKSALLTRALKLESYDPERYAAVQWVPRGWTGVDPLKETEGYVLAIQNGLDSRTRILSEQGLDVRQVMKELSEEDQLAKELGIEISKVLPATSPSASSTAGDWGSGSGNGSAAGRASKKGAHPSRIPGLLNGASAAA